ncbi:MAG TPA: hypothetical protein VMS88_03340 [Terriglobales bacterium]|nr:hypothetical protein [Terriglobales bacterium]
MPEFERDFIVRQVKQLAQAVARIVAKAHDDGQYASGLEALRTAMQAGVGKELELLRRLDPASASVLAHDPEVLDALAWITAQESDLLSGTGDAASAQELRRRALALYAECARRFPDRATECRRAARALAARTDLTSLAEEHRRWLDGPSADS